MRNRYIRIFAIMLFCFLAVSCCHKAAMLGPSKIVRKVSADKATLYVQIDMINLEGFSTYTGTAVSVAHQNDSTYVLTAGHICDGLDSKDVLVYDIVLKTQSGKGYYSEVYAVDDNFDLCLLRVKEKLPVAKIGLRSPSVGSKVSYTGYPTGFYAPGLLNRFDGYLAGQDLLGNHMYNMPATGGSSGSPIFGSDGRVYGIVSAVMLEFEHMILAVGTDNINRFLAEQGVKPAR